MISSVLEFGFTVIILYFLYDAFMADSLKEKLLSFKERKAITSGAEKIAKVKLVSDDAKDIEKFISSNANNLTMEMVNQLVARIELLKTDKVIEADDLLKKRINDLKPAEVESVVSAPNKQMNGKK